MILNSIKLTESCNKWGIKKDLALIRGSEESPAEGGERCAEPLINIWLEHTLFIIFIDVVTPQTDRDNLFR